MDEALLPPLPAYYNTIYHPWTKESGLLAFENTKFGEALRTGETGGAEEFSQQLGLPHHQSLDELQSSAQHCPICRLIERGASQNLAALAEAEKDETNMYYWANKRGPDYRLWLTKRSDRCDGFMVISPTINDFKEVWLLAAVGFCVDDKDPLHTCIPGRVIQEDSAAEKTLGRAMHWVHRCDFEHAGTKCDTGEVMLPQRVVEVRPDKHATGHVRLCEPNGLTGKYVALSHVWGKDGHFMTTRSNVEMYKKRINLTDMPKTFQDAILMTLKLGIRWLWIDSLCIIQDDDSDWQRNSANMASIYSKACLTIAATGASGNSEGLFLQRPIPEYEKFRYAKSGQDGTVYAFLLDRSAAAYIHRCILPQEPLSLRGWALQERFLASRILHFGSDQMYFECNGNFRSEDGFEIQGRCTSVYKEYHSEKYRDSSLWYYTLQEYYRRKLTKSSDKLPALSGIAKYIQGKTGDKYVAGLWQSSLIEGLTWTSMGTSRNVTSTPPEYRAPSWSWASIDGPFDHVGLGKDPLNKSTKWQDLASVVNYHVELKGENPFGEVASAWLELRAPIEPLIRIEEKEPDWQKVPLQRVSTLKTKHGDSFGACASFDRQADASALTLPLYALILVRSQQEDNRCRHQALIITPVNEHDGHYRRVGHIVMSKEELGQCEWMEDEAKYSTVILL